MGLIAAVEQLTATVTRQGEQIERLAERVSGLAQGAASLYGAVGAMAEFERFNQPPGGQL